MGKVVLVSSLDSEVVAAIRSAVRSLVKVEHLPDLSDLSVLERTPDLIVAAERHVDPAQASLLGEIRRAARRTIPVLWLVGPGAGNLMRIASDRPDGVMPLDASPRLIRRTVTRLIGGENSREQIVKLLSGFDNLRPCLREATHLALRRSPPFAKSEGVAGAVGRTPSAVTKAWTAAGLGGLRFKHFLMLIRLAVLQECIRMGLSLDEAAAHCGIPRRTAERACRTLLGITFAELGSIEGTVWITIHNRLEEVARRAS